MANTLTQTTLSAAVTASQTTFGVASATNLTAPVNNIPQQIYVVNPETTEGELMLVVGLNGTQVTVSRISLFRQAFASGSIVICGFSPANPWQGSGFHEKDPVGTVTAAEVSSVPYLNATNGHQWLRSVDGIWVSGFNNPTGIKGVTTAVASAAGAVTPSGPMFHVTGTSAITGFTIPVGFSGGSFTVIPDAVFTWTAAGNIALAGTAVVSKALTFTWDSNAAKFYPSYIA